MTKIAVTGAAGFIGFHLCRSLLSQGHSVCGFDRLNPYYDPALKLARLDILRQHSNFSFCKTDFTEMTKTREAISASQAEVVYHLAAQAGVRYSLLEPQSYVNNNLAVFLHILEACRHCSVKHLLYASSSSVYGLNHSVPFRETDLTDSPASLYAATKKSNELMAHAYAHLYGLPVTGLRFFTVYGPWGRPDMAYYKFAKFLQAGEPLPLFNQGKMERDFTYVDDVVTAMTALMDKTSPEQPPARVFNLGSGNPMSLRVFVETLAECMNCPIVENPLPMQPGDVRRTYADTTALRSVIDWQPRVSLQEGLKKFVAWFLKEGKKYHLETDKKTPNTD